MTMDEWVNLKKGDKVEYMGSHATVIVRNSGMIGALLQFDNGRKEKVTNPNLLSYIDQPEV